MQHISATSLTQHNLHFKDEDADTPGRCRHARWSHRWETAMLRASKATVLSSSEESYRHHHSIYLNTWLQEEEAEANALRRMRSYWLVFGCGWGASGPAMTRALPASLSCVPRLSGLPAGSPSKGQDACQAAG